MEPQPDSPSAKFLWTESDVRVRKTEHFSSTSWRQLLLCPCSDDPAASLAASEGSKRSWGNSEQLEDKVRKCCSQRATDLPKQLQLHLEFSHSYLVINVAETTSKSSAGCTVWSSPEIHRVIDKCVQWIFCSYVVLIEEAKGHVAVPSPQWKVGHRAMMIMGAWVADLGCQLMFSAIRNAG